MEYKNFPRIHVKCIEIAGKEREEKGTETFVEENKSTYQNSVLDSWKVCYFLSY